jgi:hypothetical protein
MDGADTHELVHFIRGEAAPVHFIRGEAAPDEKFLHPSHAQAASY